MDCQKIQDLLPLFLKKQITEVENNNIQKHLSTCSTCESELEQYKKVLMVVGMIEVVDPSPDFATKLAKLTTQTDKSISLDKDVPGYQEICGFLWIYWKYRFRQSPTRALLVWVLVLLVFALPFLYVECYRYFTYPNKYETLPAWHLPIEEDN